MSIASIGANTYTMLSYCNTSLPSSVVGDTMWADWNQPRRGHLYHGYRQTREFFYFTPFLLSSTWTKCPALAVQPTSTDWQCGSVFHNYCVNKQREFSIGQWQLVSTAKFTTTLHFWTKKIHLLFPNLFIQPRVHMIKRRTMYLKSCDHVSFLVP